MVSKREEFILALLLLALALMAIFIWIPLDSETPAVFSFRRQTFIGDAMLPLFAAGGIAVFAALHLLVLFLRPSATDPASSFDHLTLVFFSLLVLIVMVSMLLMYWSGPVALAWFGSSGEAEITYRQVRADMPWKYIGFVLGGFVMVFGITSLLEGRFTLRRAFSSAVAVLVLILIFDVPFDSLLLPPNGDY